MADEAFTLPVRVVDQFTSPLAKLRAEMSRVTQAPGIKAMQADWAKVSASVGGVSREVSTNLLPAFTGLNAASLGVAGAITAAALGFKNFVGNATSLRTLSQETGVAVDKLRALETLGGRLNIDPSQMAGAVRTFATNMDQMRRHVGSAYQELLTRPGGKDLLESIINAPSISDAMDKAMSGLGGIQNPQRRQEIARLLFGTDDMSALAGRYGQEIIGELRKIMGSQAPINEGAVQKAQDALNTMFEKLKVLREEGFGKALDSVNQLIDRFGKPVTGGIVQAVTDLAAALNTVADIAQKIDKGEYGGALKALLGAAAGTPEGKAGLAIGQALRRQITGAPATADEAQQQAQERLDSLIRQRGLTEDRMRGAFGGGRTALERTRDKLTEEIEKLTSELRKMREQGATVQQQSFGGGGFGGGGFGSLIQSAAFGGMGGFGGGGDDNADRRTLGSPIERMRDVAQLRRRYSGGSPDGGAATAGAGEPGSDSGIRGGRSPAGRNARAMFLMRGLIARGMTATQAAVVVGNMMEESTLNPRAWNAGEAATGLIQWREGRRERLMALARSRGETSPGDDTQLDHVMNELRGSEARSGLLGAQDLQSANLAAKRWIRYGSPTFGDRLNHARNFLRMYQAGGGGGDSPSSGRVSGDAGFIRDDKSWGGPATGMGPGDARSRPLPAYGHNSQPGDEMMRRAMGPSNVHKVEGSASLDITFNGLPSPNYRARTSMSGMFKDVNVSPGKSQVSGVGGEGEDI